ncbi:HAD family hydrolase [Streptomyces sp. ISL-10]|uniref:HAD family hydrolase n=1 Tax=Streptomyces sp. ISL-10 TaxID=2819172 RepID=UPI001BEA1352|nr:HAD family hydrolase [Streptomyces sp. ISL-10]MBT2366021.1 HAD family hydrolase [Streptomyces sp. ISL-10]
MAPTNGRPGPGRPRPGAVLMDFSGTLFDDTSVIRPERLIARCAARGRELGHAQAQRLCTGILAVVDSADGRARRENADLSADRHRAIWTALAASAPGSDALIAEAFYDCVIAADGWHPYPDTPQVLRALHAAEVPVAVVSNTGWDIRGSFTHAGLDGLVTRFVLSCELGVQKPDPALFRTACDLLGVPPGHALMVGDDPVRDGAATTAGIPAYILPVARGPLRPRGLAAVTDLLGTAVS